MTLSAAPGGRREAIVSLARRSRMLGVSTHLICLDQLGSSESSFSPAFDSAHALKRRSMYQGSVIRTLRRHCRSLKVDLLHTHDAASQFTSTLLRLTGHAPKIVTTFHRTLGFESARLRDRARNAWAGLFTEAIIVGSRERGEHYLDQNWVDSGKVVRIPFGVDLNRFRADTQARQAIRSSLQISNDTVLLGVAGHFGRVKGLDIAVRAFEQLIRRSPSRRIKLLIVGKGNPEEEATLRALTAGMPEGSVVFVGFRDDVELYFAAMDLFVHTPRLEAFGLVVAEAMATGLPVVATRVGGLMDMVRPDETGILVLPEDPEAAANAVMSLLNDDDKRVSMGRRAAQVAAEEYGLDLYALRHVQLYNRVLGRDSSTDERTILSAPLHSPSPNGAIL